MEFLCVMGGMFLIDDICYVEFVMGFMGVSVEMVSVYCDCIG